MLGIQVHFGKVDRVYHTSHIQTIRSHINRGFDIIHTHLFSPQLFSVLAKLFIFKRVKLITTEHNTHNRRREKRIFKILDKWMYSQYDKIIVITEGTKIQLKKYLPSTVNKLIVIENGIKLNQYVNAIPLQSKDLVGHYKENDVLVLMVAALREQKDHKTVIRASRLLPENYHIIFVGDGERMSTLQNYTKEYGSERIHFLGRRSDIPAIMKTCDLFVLSSRWEGFGLVAVEAMAAGLPVILSNVPGMRDVAEKVANFFEVGNEHELAELIVMVSNDVDLQDTIIEKGKKQSVNYSIQKTVQGYIDCYLNVLNDSK